MERLTGRNQYGGIVSRIKDTHRDVERGKLLHALAAYEEAGLTPKRISELAAAEKDGRLVVLPCKVGDTMYYTDYVVDTVKECTVFSFEFREEVDVTDKRIWFREGGWLQIKSIGECLFLTPEEAETAIQRWCTSP